MDEKKIEEVMALVQDHAKCHRASFMGTAKQCSEYRSYTDKLRNQIETKLRQLLGEQHG